MSDFIITKEYKRFVEFCTACRKEKYIGLCYGPAGVGKTMSAINFTKWDSLSKELDKFSRSFDDSLPSIDIKCLYSIVYTPEINNTPRCIKEEIESLILRFNAIKYKAIHLKDLYIEYPEYVSLLIIDEADRLQPKCLEQIRDIYDRKNIAVILIGMPGIEKRLIRFPQLYSRIGFAYEFKPLSVEEISFIVQEHCAKLGIDIVDKDFTDREAILTIIQITHGNFRLINRLLKQVIRIMTVNKLASISKEIVEAARECLVIGNV